MNPIDQSGRSNTRPSGGRGRLLLSAVVLIVLAGCESGFGSKREGDPLVGIHGSPAPVPVTGTTNNPTAKASAGPIPQLPASYNAPGTAPMAGGDTATSENARDLRMTTDTVTPASLPSAGAARGVAPGVTVGNPEPAQPGTTSNLATPPVVGGLGTAASAPPPPGGGAANIRTYEDAKRFLDQHGVNWQKLSGDEGEWKFACGIPNPSNPHINKNYETKKPFPDYLSAMRAVIAQIEETPR
jgi:hypothetical protein